MCLLPSRYLRLVRKERAAFAYRSCSRILIDPQPDDRARQASYVLSLSFFALLHASPRRESFAQRPARN